MASDTVTTTATDTATATSVPYLQPDTYMEFKEIHSVISRDVFYAVFNDIISTYSPIPYHSYIHGCDVMKVGYELLSKSRLLAMMSENDVLTYLFALLGHDAGHPGLKNHTEITRIKSLFPDARSPLEEYHHRILVGVLDSHKIQYNAELLYCIVLATDPTLPYCEIAKRFPVELKALVPMIPIIKLADVNHTVGSFEKHMDWTWNLGKELETVMTPRAQQQFLLKYVAPILEETKEVLDAEFHWRLTRNLRWNIEYWEYKMGR